MICIFVSTIFKSMFTRSIFCSSHDIRALGILKMFQFRIDMVFFRESLAKVLLKPWRKTAFIWRLGGLNCGLAKASLQEYCSLDVEVSELADKGEQGPKYYAKTSSLNVQHCAATQKNYGGSFVRAPVPYSPDVPLKLNMDMAKGWRKYFFFSEDVLFRVKEFRTALTYVKARLLDWWCSLSTACKTALCTW